MTDREMLELAAKAAGLNVQRCRLDDRINRDFLINGTSPRNIGQKAYPWNPLTDDGDALRLAVRLNIPVYPYEDETSTGTVGVVAKNWGSKEANTRRAIVRAAAEMGKQMGGGDV